MSERGDSLREKRSYAKPSIIARRLIKAEEALSPPKRKEDCLLGEETSLCAENGSRISSDSLKDRKKSAKKKRSEHLVKRR